MKKKDRGLLSGGTQGAIELFKLGAAACVLKPMYLPPLDKYECDIALGEAVVEVLPDDLEALAMLAHAYTRTGRHEEGLRTDLRMLRLVPDDSTVNYNIACSYALLGRTPEALTALRRAIRLGFLNLSHLSEDPDLDSLREEPVFKEILQEAEERVRRLLERMGQTEKND